MDTHITNWEMSLDTDQNAMAKEEIATWPSEPYKLDWNAINWN
ncbi:MAG: hypothetical protein ACXWB9_08010 [Flavisolibacter sp.]